MSKRLQVVLPDHELERLQAAAKRQGLTVSEWVRQVLRRAQHESAGGDVGAKLTAVRAASLHAFPAPDIDRMLAEIDAGRDLR